MVFNIPNLMYAYYRDDDLHSTLRMENLDQKLALFNEWCKLTGTSNNKKLRAYARKLTEVALKHYFDGRKGINLNYQALFRVSRQRFITAEYTRTLIRELYETTLRTMMGAKSNLTPTEYLECFVSRLQDIDSALPKAYRGKEILHKTILNAVN